MRRTLDPDRNLEQESLRLQDPDDPIDERRDGRVIEMTGPIEDQVGTGGKQPIWPHVA